MTSILLTHQEVTWINILHPSQQDMDDLSKRCPNFHTLNLKDCLTELEYPKLDHFDHYLFLVVQMPYQDDHNHSLRPAEVDIFIEENTLVTSHRGELQALQTMFSTAQSNPQQRTEWMSSGASTLLYHLLNALVDDCYPIVQRLGHNLHHVEQNLFNNHTRHLLDEISSLRRDIIVLRGILKSQQEIILALIRGNWLFIHEHLDPYWGDISNHLSQLCLLADQYSEVINGLADTVDTLASHRIDEVIRLLTNTTILTLPVTLLATIFGMNIIMPWGDHPVLFFGIILIGAVITIWLVWYLRKKKWL